MNETRMVHLTCYYCDQWWHGHRTDDQIVAWFDIHRSPGVTASDFFVDESEAESDNPHICEDR